MSSVQMERIGEHLQKLKLFKIHERLEAMLQMATQKELAYSDFLGQLLAEEVTAKTDKAVVLRTKMARFPFVKSLETFDLEYQPSLDEKQIRELSTCRFIDHGDNVGFRGPP